MKLLESVQPAPTSAPREPASLSCSLIKMDTSVLFLHCKLKHTVLYAQWFTQSGLTLLFSSVLTQTEEDQLGCFALETALKWLWVYAAVTKLFKKHFKIKVAQLSYRICNKIEAAASSRSFKIKSKTSTLDDLLFALIGRGNDRN